MKEEFSIKISCGANSETIKVILDYDIVEPTNESEILDNLVEHLINLSNEGEEFKLD